MSTAQVRLSADQMAVVAGEASSSAWRSPTVSDPRRCWKEKGTPIGKFIDVLEAQATRLRCDLTALGDSLRAAPMFTTDRIRGRRGYRRCGAVRIERQPISATIAAAPDRRQDVSIEFARGNTPGLADH